MELSEIAMCEDVSALWTCMQEAKAAADGPRARAVKSRMAELAGDMKVFSDASEPKLVARSKDGRGAAVDKDWEPIRSKAIYQATSTQM